MSSQAIEAPPEAIALPEIDGQEIDRIELNFSGTIRLDRSDPADVALFRRCMMGKKIEVKVEATAAGKDGRIAWDEDGYPGETTARAKLKVTSVWRPVEEGVEVRTGSNQTELTAVE